ncbi:hypothetical protein EsH8_III_001296 [Colletotrichum jinshuiense]
MATAIQALKGDAPQQVRSLYRQLLRTGDQFAAYNFREYAKRRTRDAFREHQHVEDPRQVQELIQKGLNELQGLKRQTVVSQFFQFDRLVVEGGAAGKQKGNKGGIVRQKEQGLVPKSRSGANLSTLWLQFSLSIDETPQSVRTRRANRSGYTEHDDFEGLPVRQWRQEWVSVEPPAPVETTQKNDIWDVELPWGMPKDAGLLPQHSQDLLRAARSGVLYKRPAPAEEEEADADAVAEKPEKKEDEASSKGFQIKVWKQINRNSEGSPVSHLAKRRKGTVTISSKTVTSHAPGATVTKATVRRVDAAGNPYTQEITLQAGQAVEGEIISTTVVSVAAVDPAQAQPQRARRPPPPKKKNKPGPGRGRKKKILPLPAPASGAPDAAPLADGAPAEPKVEGAEGADAAVKQEREDSNNPDSEMADNDEEDGDDDGDDGEDGDDGDEEQRDGENTDSQDQEMTDASPTVPTPTVDTLTELTDPESPVPKRAALPPNPINLAPPHLANSSPKGSPLKNVVLPSPTEPPTQFSPIAEALVPKSEPEQADVPMADGPEPASQAPTEPVDAAAIPDQPPVDTMAEDVQDATFIPPAEKVGDIVSPMAETRSTFSLATTAETEASGTRLESGDQTVASNDAPQDLMALDIPEELGTAQASEASDTPKIPDVISTSEVPSAEELPAPAVEDMMEQDEDSTPVPPTSIEEPPAPAPAPEAESGAPVVEDVPSAPPVLEQPSEPAQSPAKSPAKSPAALPEPPAPIEPPVVAAADIPPEIPVEVPVEAPAEVPVEVPVETPVEAAVEAAVEAPAEAPVETFVDAPAEAPIDVPIEAPAAPVEALAEAPAEVPVEVPTAEAESIPPSIAEVPMVAEDDVPDLLAGLETELDRQAEIGKSPVPEPPAAPHPEPAELPEVANPVPLPEVPPIEPEKPAEEPAEAPKDAPETTATPPAPDNAPVAPADADAAPATEPPASAEAAPAEEAEKEAEKKADATADAPAPAADA